MNTTDTTIEELIQKDGLRMVLQAVKLACFEQAGQRRTKAVGLYTARQWEKMAVVLSRAQDKATELGL